MFDISDLVSSEQESKRLLDAVALLREKCMVYAVHYNVWCMLFIIMYGVCCSL